MALSLSPERKFGDQFIELKVGMNMEREVDVPQAYNGRSKIFGKVTGVEEYFETFGRPTDGPVRSDAGPLSWGGQICRGAGRTNTIGGVTRPSDGLGVVALLESFLPLGGLTPIYFLLDLL